MLPLLAPTTLLLTDAQISPSAAVSSTDQLADAEGAPAQNRFVLSNGVARFVAKQRDKRALHEVSSTATEFDAPSMKGPGAGMS